MMRRFALCILCIIALSACDSGSAPPARTVEDDDSYVPIDLTTVFENVSGMVMSGAINHNTGDVSAYAIQRFDQSPVYQQIDIDTRTDYILRFVYRFGIPAGEYPITTSPEENPPENEFSAGLLNLWSPNPEDEYTINPQGTVTIDYQNDFIIGSYTFSVQNPAGDTVDIVGQYYAEEIEPPMR